MEKIYLLIIVVYKKLVANCNILTLSIICLPDPRWKRIWLFTLCKYLRMKGYPWVRMLKLRKKSESFVEL